MIANFARQAEAAGVDSIWMGEHVVLFDETEFPYPYRQRGRVRRLVFGRLRQTGSEKVSERCFGLLFPSLQPFHVSLITVQHNATMSTCNVRGTYGMYMYMYIRAPGSR